ncbi:MAG: hypothetical protein ABWJ42_06265 [Sulfolobales archaeon]
MKVLIERVYRGEDPRLFIDRLMRDPEIISPKYREVRRYNDKHLMILDASITIGSNEIFRGDIEISKEIYQPLKIVFRDIRGRVFEFRLSFARVSREEFIVRLTCSCEDYTLREYADSLLKYLEEQFILYFPEIFKRVES